MTDDATFNGDAPAAALGVDLAADEGPTGVRTWWDGVSAEEKQRDALQAKLDALNGPGVGVNNAADLGIPPDHVWASHAAFDPIPPASASESWFLDTVDSLSQGMLGTDKPAPDDLIFGKDPTSAEFGGHTFSSDWDKPVVEAHGSYWDDENAARKNMANIITGQPELVT